MPCTHYLGCFGHCPAVNLGLKSVQEGAHTFKLFFAGHYYTFRKTFFIGEELSLPGSRLNESARFLLSIYNPDGSLYSGMLMNSTSLNVDTFSFDVVIERNL